MGTNFVEESAASIFSVRDEVAGSSEMSVNIYQATKRHIQDGSNFRSHCHENLKPHNTSIPREPHPPQRPCHVRTAAAYHQGLLQTLLTV